MATKRDLIERITGKINYLSKRDINEIIELLSKFITDELSKDNRIEIRGFGSLSIRKRKYSGKKEFYNSIYYRMSKNLDEKLNK